MSSLSDAKVLGGIGALLVLFTAVPTVGWVLGIAGFVLILVAINNISKLVNDKEMFRNMRTAILLAIGAIAVGTATVLGAAYHVFTSMGSFVGSKFVLTPNIPISEWVGLAILVVGGLLAVWAILVVSAVYVRRSYNSMASRLNVKMFEKAGWFYLIGAATVIIGVGLLLILVSQILLAVAFLSIPEEQRYLQAQVPNVTS